MDFNPKQWHHGYIGAFIFLIALISAGFAKWLFKTWSGRIVLFIASVLIIDELTQIFIFGQYGGILHWLYIETGLYEIGWIRELNHFLDRLFG